MKTSTVTSNAVVAQEVSLNFVDAILLAKKIKTVRQSIFKGGLNEEGKYVQFYGRLNDEQMGDIAALCIFIERITCELGVDFNESHLELFGEAGEYAEKQAAIV